VEYILHREIRDLTLFSTLRPAQVSLERMRNTSKESRPAAARMVKAAAVTTPAVATAAVPTQSIQREAAGAATQVATTPPSTSYGEEEGTSAAAAVGAVGRRSKGAIRRGRGLESSLEFEPGLRNFWYPAEFSEVRPDGLAQ
jgi:chlorophyllide a oxygenase